MVPATEAPTFGATPVYIGERNRVVLGLEPVDAAVPIGKVPTEPGRLEPAGTE